MRFYDIGESPLMGHSEKHIAPLVLGGIIAAGAFVNPTEDLPF